MKVLIEGSGRHLHITKEDLATLFGADFELEVKKTLSQPGEFASHSKLDIIGPKGTIKGISILGPCRKVTQIELSFTDARILGLDCPIRESGDIAGSAPCALVGPKGTLELKEGCIIAKRHVHMTPEDAASIGVVDKQIISVKTEGDRSVTWHEVVARVSANYATAMHIDYDEINAANIGKDNTWGEIIL